MCTLAFQVTWSPPAWVRTTAITSAPIVPV